MADTNYPIPEKPVYDPNIRALQDSDPARASTVLNPLFTQIIGNVHAVKQDSDQHAVDIETVRQAAEQAQQTADKAGQDASGACKAYRYTATIPTSGWSSAKPYTLVVSVPGLTAEMTPVVDVIQSSDATAAAQQLTAWSTISRMVTGVDTVTVYCYEEKPSVNIPVQFTGVI